MKKIVVLILIALFIPSTNYSGSEIPLELDVAIIVNNNNPVEKLSVTEVRLFWMKRGTQKVWPGLKTNVLPVDRKGSSPEKTLFYKIVVKLTEAEVDSYFAAKQYQSNEAPPVKLNSDKEVLQYVTDNKGAIGFVKASSLTSEWISGVKVITPIKD